MKNEVTDDSPINLTQLAKAMNMGVSTIYKFRSLGYQMEFGIRTTPGHFKKWIREYYEKKRQEEQADLKAALARLE